MAARAIAGMDKTAEAQRYPTPGIIYDKDANLYLKDPAYWQWWDRPVKPGYPADDQVESYITSPPALWWEQRMHWRNKWKQLGTEVEGDAHFPYDGQPPPGWNGRCVKEPGLLKGDWGRPKLWFEWLEGPPDPLDWKAGLKSAAKSAVGDFVGNFFDSDKCTLPIRLDTPSSEFWKEDGQAGYDLEQPGAPWPRRGTFRREKADQKVFMDWKQEQWLAEHSLRRSTQKGFPRALSPRGLENATPRFEDRFAEDEPATLDPRLPRPAGLPDLRKYPQNQQEDMIKDARMEAFTGEVDALGIKSLGGDMMSGMLGADMMQMKAYKRLMQVEPEWVDRYLEGKVSQEEHPVAYGIDETTFQTEKEPEHPLLQPTPPPWHPGDVLKKFPSFEKIWKAKMKRALDAAANMSRLSGHDAREAQDQLDHRWQQLSTPPDNSFKGLMKRAEAEAEAERGSEPPVVTAAEEAEVRMNSMATANAADVEKVAESPLDRVAAINAGVSKGADTTIPEAEKVDAQEAATPAATRRSAGAGTGSNVPSADVQAASSKKGGSRSPRKSSDALASQDAYTSIGGPSKVDPVADPVAMSSASFALMCAAGPRRRKLSASSFL